MFSSNQVLQISGSLEVNEIKRVLELVLRIAGHDRTWDGRPNDCQYIWQIASSGAFCIGYRYGAAPEEHWNDFQFGYDSDMVAIAIKKQLSSLKFPTEWDYADGSTERGFLAEVIDNSFAEEKDGIKNPRWGIVKFSPFTCFYHK